MDTSNRRLLAIVGRTFKVLLSKTNGLYNLYLSLALLEYHMDWLAQFYDNVTEWKIWLQCRYHGIPVRQPYYITMVAPVTSRCPF